MINFAEELDQYENKVIEKFRNHSVLTNLSDLSNLEFEELLLQRRFLSMHFTPFCEQILIGLEDNEAKEVDKADVPNVTIESLQNQANFLNDQINAVNKMIHHLRSR